MPDDARSGPILWLPALLIASFLAGCDGPPPVVSALGSLKGHSREVVSLAFSPDGKSLVSRSPEAVKVWDLETRSVRKSFPSDGSDFATVAFAPDGGKVAENLAAKGAIAWDLATGASRTYAIPAQPRAMAGDSFSHGWGLAYSPDGKTLAGGASNVGSKGFVTLWDVESGKMTQLGDYASPVTTVAFSPDGRRIASGSMSGVVEVAGTADGLVQARIQAGRPYLASVAFSPDGRTLAIASDDRRVKLWDAATGEVGTILKGHMKAISSIAYHPGGRILASSDSGGNIFLWDVRGRRQVARLEGHRGKVWAVAFAPDGRTLASAGEDREIRLWDVSKRIGDLAR